jgi:DNA-binding protein H-NS
MKSIDLNTLPLSELLKIEKKLPKAILKAKKLEKTALRKKMEKLAAESGFDLSEVISGDIQKPKYKVKAKYRNPADENETWTGRGRKPRWAQKLLNEGGSLEDVLI